MTRATLRDRRASLTIKIKHRLPDGKEMDGILMTVGFDEFHRKVKEIFCASFKAGTEMNVLCADACVLTSLLLQHGYSAKELTARLAEGPSLIGTLLQAAAKIDEERA